VIGIEIQHALVVAARELAAGVRLSRSTVVEGDAAAEADTVAAGTVVFLYCPFGGERLDAVLAALEPTAHTHARRICCVDLPLPSRPWLAREMASSGELAIYRVTRSQ
jgi:hypothetical protein